MGLAVDAGYRLGAQLRLQLECLSVVPTGSEEHPKVGVPRSGRSCQAYEATSGAIQHTLCYTPLTGAVTGLTQTKGNRDIVSTSY